MATEVDVGYYFLALIDIVGQRDKLRRWVSLPSNDVQRRDVARILGETSEYVKELRRQFDELFDAAARPTGVLDRLNPEQRALAEKRKQAILWRRGFSDSYFLTVPCWYEPSWGVHSRAIYRSLFSICGLFIWALAKGQPFRGAVEVGLGTEISEHEVYGPVNVRVVELERHAGYPRIVVGDGLLSHLGDLEGRCPNNLDGRDTRHCIQDCRGLVTTDHTGTVILDPLGEGMRRVPGAVPPEMVQLAYGFVVSQEQSFSKSNEKLHGYYGDLRKYCESRLPIWGLASVQ